MKRMIHVGNSQRTNEQTNERANELTNGRPHWGGREKEQGKKDEKNKRKDERKKRSIRGKVGESAQKILTTELWLAG